MKIIFCAYSGKTIVAHPLEAELLALKKDLEVCKGLHVTALQIEDDSLMLISSIQQATNMAWDLMHLWKSTVEVLTSIHTSHLEILLLRKGSRMQWHMCSPNQTSRCSMNSMHPSHQQSSTKTPKNKVGQQNTQGHSTIVWILLLKRPAYQFCYQTIQNRPMAGPERKMQGQVPHTKTRHGFCSRVRGSQLLLLILVVHTFWVTILLSYVVLGEVSESLLFCNTVTLISF